MMLDPADCGPAFFGMCQDIQAEAFDYPESFFEPPGPAGARGRGPTTSPAGRRGRPAAQKPTSRSSSPAAACTTALRDARARRPSPDRHNVPVVETHRRARRCCSHDHPMNAGAIGVIGSRPRPTSSPPRPTWCWRSARGCRTSPPAPGRCSATTPASSRSTPRASMHQAQACRWSAMPRSAWTELSAGARRLGGPASWTERGGQAICRVEPDGRPASAADQRRAADLCPCGRRGQPPPAEPTDLALTAAGGMPGEL